EFVRIRLPPPNSHEFSYPGEAVTSEVGMVVEWVTRMPAPGASIPDAVPRVPGYQLALAHRSATPGTGDWVESFQRHDQRTALFVGTGNGPGSGVRPRLTSLQTLWRTQPCLHTDPGTTLTAVSRLLRSEVPSDPFVRCLYLLFDDHGLVCWAA